MSDRKHITRNHNASKTKRMRYNKDEFRVDIYQFDKSLEQTWGIKDVSKATNAAEVSASSYQVYQPSDITKPMTLQFNIHPKQAGTYRLEMLYVNTHTTSQNYVKSVSVSLTKANYQKVAKSFSSTCSKTHCTPKSINNTKKDLDFRAMLYGFATALTNSLPSSVSFNNTNFKNPITYLKSSNQGSTVKRTDIVTQAKSLKSTIDKNGSTPKTVTVGKIQVNIAQFAYLMALAINSSASTFKVIDVITGSSYVSGNANFSVSVDGEVIPNKGATQGFDVVHSRAYTYFTITDEQVKKYGEIDGKALEIKYTFNTANTAFFALVMKKYNLYSADKMNSDDCQLTAKSFNVQLTNDFTVDSASVNFMYHHGLDDATGLNLSGFLIDYRDEINIFVKDNAGQTVQVFGGFVSTVEVNEDLTTLSVTAASRLIDLDHRTSISEIYMNSITDITEYNEKYDYTKKCNNWSSALAFLCNYSELPLNTNISDSNPLIKNKIFKEVYYGSDTNRFKNLTTSNMKVTANTKSVVLRNGSKSNVYQSVRIFDDKLMKVENKVVLNDYPNIWIDYGLGAEVTEE